MAHLVPILSELVPNKEQAEKLRSLKTDDEIFRQLLKLGKTAPEIFAALKRYWGMDFIDLEQTPIDRAVLGLVNIQSLRILQAVPLGVSGNTFMFAISPTSTEKDAITALCEKERKKAVFFYAFPSDIERKFRELEKTQVSVPKDTSQRVATSAENDTVAWVNAVIRKGIALQASDIHVEPREDSVQIRYRVDGILSVKDMYPIDANGLSSIITRLKIMSQMDIAEKRKPQDGRIPDFVDGKEIYDIRVSTTNTQYGEKVVMRIFNKDSRILSFSQLGFSESDERRVRTMLSNRQGIVYLAGATGSGKTTTLYSMIDALDGEKLNIYTIEDPIERTLGNINQIQIEEQAGITYASTLRSLLRQDPDVISVGEIRDFETADLAIRASLTGHLVLTTIHANNAIETISRLFNMGVEPYLLSTSVLGFMSQKLARILCPHCKQEAEPTASEKAWLDSVKAKYGKDSEGQRFFRSTGCERCNGLGYKGRTALAEVLVMTDSIRNLVAKREFTNVIYAKALEEGFIPIELDGYLKACQGVTSIDEVIRVL